MILRNESLAKYCTFGVGGPANYFVEARTEDELKNALAFAANEKIPFYILGKGSNTLFADRGYQGLIVRNMTNYLTRTSPHTISVSAGYSFTRLGTQTAKWGLSGLEFASGIPGSVGGAVYMNAGANGFEVCSHLQNVTYLHPNGEITTYNIHELPFSYRSSPFQQMAGCILSATFSLAPSNHAREKQLTILSYRKDTQPLSEMSAGCIFRNPPSLSAGQLIDQCSLKGLRIGNAEVSPLHGNFIVNRGGATAHDILTLIRTVQDEVQQQKKITLIPEIKIVPYD